MNEDLQVGLEPRDMPRAWYNLQADLPHPAPPPVDREGNPVTPDSLASVFPMNLIEQEMCADRWVEIPGAVLETLMRWRPTPLCRARGLERALQTPAKIFYKNEGVSPAGSHKPNTAVAQAYYNRQAGIRHLTTETGAGQWGSALAMACRLFGLDCRVYMVRISFEQKPMRKQMMRVWGAECISSPSRRTEAGRRILETLPDTPGSLGIAISEAIEDAVTSKDTRYSLGSVLNHVLLHQTIIGLEAKAQFAKIGAYPDVVIGCAGGGSNFAGLAFPFLCDRIHGREVRVLAAEPEACPRLTRAPYVYDSGDVAMMTPLLAMNSLGHTFIPPPIHAGGLRYHGMAPLVCHALREGLIEALALPQLECYEAAVLWARTEGFIPAPETAHAVAAAVRVARRAREEGRAPTIVLNWSGHGLMDLSGYDAYLSGTLSNCVLSDEEMARSLRDLEGLPRPPPLAGSPGPGNASRRPS